MSKDSAAADSSIRFLRLIDREAVTKIACDLVDIPSPTGYEKNCADYILIGTGLPGSKSSISSSKISDRMPLESSKAAAPGRP